MSSREVTTDLMDAELKSIIGSEGDVDLVRIKLLGQSLNYVVEAPLLSKEDFYSIVADVEYVMGWDND